MSTPRPPRSTDDIVAGLVDDLRPVRRPWHPMSWLLAWLGGAALVVAVGVTAHGRPDLGGRLHDVPFLIELAVCFGLALRLGRAALDAATPDRRNERVERLGPVLALAILTALALLHPSDRGAFAAVGMERWRCAALTMLFGALPGLTMLAALRRGAPLAPRAAALLAGAAAAAVTYGAMRAACAADEGLHLMVWHALPCAVVVGLTASIGTAWLRGWRAE